MESKCDRSTYAHEGRAVKLAVAPTELAALPQECPVGQEPLEPSLPDLRHPFSTAFVSSLQGHPDDQMRSIQHVGQSTKSVFVSKGTSKHRGAVKS
jgi:hypothetical protein